MKKIFKVFLCAVAVAGLLFFISDSRIIKRKYRISSKKFSGELNIVHLSDLHSCFYGEEQKTIMEMLERENPDVVLLSGDILDDKMDEAGTISLISQIGEKYKCYYATGNHEIWTGEIDRVKALFRENNITVLEGEKAEIDINGNKVDIFGVDDPEIGEDEFYRQFTNVIAKTNKERYTILISHRPELEEFYEGFRGDLVVSGHAHGGQWRIPNLLNGLYAPNQGFLPKYAGGLYSFSDCKLIVSRGLSKENTIVPRIFNRPEFVVIRVLGKK